MFISNILFHNNEYCLHYFSSSLQHRPPEVQPALAAKARIHRMIQPKSKRRELLAPDYVAKEWQNGDKNGMGIRMAWRTYLCQSIGQRTLVPFKFDDS